MVEDQSLQNYFAGIGAEFTTNSHTIKFVLCSTHMIAKFVLGLNFEMPTTVGIYKFMARTKIFSYDLSK